MKEISRKALLACIPLVLSALAPITSSQAAGGTCTSGSLQIVDNVLVSRGTCVNSATIPATVTAISASAFRDDGFVSSVTFEAGSQLTTIGARAFQNSSIGPISIPDSVTVFGDYAFAGAANLESVTFGTGSNLQDIGDFAFDAALLRTFELPATVIEIGNQAFANTGSLTEFVFRSGSALSTIGGGAFLMSGLTSITIPASVTTIGFGAFEQMSDIETADFSAATGLEEIPPYFFHYSSLQSVKLPRGLKIIGFSAFYNTLLSEVTIPASVTEIGNDAFGDNPGLTTVRFLGSTAPATVGTGVFSNSVARAIVPAGSTSYGPDGSIWNNLTVSIEPSSGGSGALVVPPPAEVMEKVTAFKLSSPSLGKPQKVKIREIVSEVGKKASYTIRAGINKVPGLSKKQEKALARSRAEAIREYLIKLGIKKSKIKISVKLFDPGEEAKTRLVGKKT